MPFNPENPFRPTDKRATRRLFKNGKEKKLSLKNQTKLEQFKQTQYGPYEILNYQVQFLKKIEKLIPDYLLQVERKTAQEILIDRIRKVENGNIIFLNLNLLHLSSLPELPRKLELFYCQNNYLEKLPTLPRYLRSLDCANNQLTSLPTLPNSLNSLDCANNQLASLPTLPDTMETLVCRDNKLKELPNFPTSLQQLHYGRNPFTKETITKINNLPIARKLL